VPYDCQLSWLAAHSHPVLHAINGASNHLYAGSGSAIHWLPMNKVPALKSFADDGANPNLRRVVSVCGNVDKSIHDPPSRSAKSETFEFDAANDVGRTCLDVDRHDAKRMPDI
jgi:hypothetical protein